MTSEDTPSTTDETPQLATAAHVASPNSIADSDNKAGATQGKPHTVKSVRTAAAPRRPSTPQERADNIERNGLARVEELMQAQAAAVTAESGEPSADANRRNERNERGSMTEIEALELANKVDPVLANLEEPIVLRNPENPIRRVAANAIETRELIVSETSFDDDEESPVATIAAVAAAELENPGPSASVEVRPAEPKDEGGEIVLAGKEGEQKAPPEDRPLFEQRSVKELVKIGQNSYIKKLAKFNPNPQDIIIEDIQGTEEDFRRTYLESRNNLLTAPRIARVPQILSGYHVETSAFSHADVISVNRNLLEADYVNRLELILSAVYDHIAHTSLGEIEFDNWTKRTLYPDMDSVYFGLYAATYPGVNEYNLTCNACEGEFDHEVDNNELAYIVGKFTSADEARIIMSGNDPQIRQTSIYKRSHAMPIRRVLKESKIAIEYSFPSIHDFVMTVKAMKTSDKWENIGNIEMVRSREYPFMRIYPYISRVGFPILNKDGDRTVVTYRGTQDRNTIVATLDSLSHVDFDDMFDDPNVIDMINLRGIQYSIKDVVCKHCEAKITAVPLNMRTMFFSKVQQTHQL